jgi:hypothetical protein
MSRVQVFDPPLCCPTGVCGPSVDPVLPRVAADLSWLAEQGVEVQRYNLAQEPVAFAEHALVRETLAAHGQESLPLVLVDGRVVAEGTYPGREALAALAGIRLTSKLNILPVAAESSCCSDDDDDDCCGDSESEAEAEGECKPGSGCC